ncbi:hypothetical protein LC609_21375 [Nostoc sp. XA013]|nr:hypothetical protein [Nostoc sp. XA013]
MSVSKALNPSKSTPFAPFGETPDARTSLRDAARTLMLRPWRLPLGEDRSGSL